jgi:hypothetical protein
VTKWIHWVGCEVAGRWMTKEKEKKKKEFSCSKETMRYGMCCADE